MLRLNFIIIFLRPYSDLVPVPGHGAQVLKWTLFTHASARTKNVHKHLGKGYNYREISGKFGAVASTAYKKVNAMRTDENRITCSDYYPCLGTVPKLVPGYSKRLCPDWCPCPGTVPKLVLGHQQKAMFRLVPMPGHGAQISARAPTTGYVQTSARAQARCPN